ncbi:MAG: cytochrome c biogenesis protein CcdA [Bacteroidota bacterium]
MRHLIALFTLLLLCQCSSDPAQAQVLKPTKLSYELSSTEPISVGEEVEVIFKAKIDPDWYLYSSDFDPDLGPQVSRVVFTPSDSYELVGELRPIKPKKKYDDLWGGDYTYFKKTGEFRQTIKILKPNPSIQAVFEGQTCTDLGKCILVEEEFDISIPTTGEAIAAPEEVKGDENVEEVKQEDTENAEVTPQTEEENPTIEEEQPEETQTEEAVTEVKPESKEETTIQQGGTAYNGYYPDGEPFIKVDKTILGEAKQDNSIWVFALLSFLGGFAALLTPCVFPIIPMTVSFFTKKDDKRSKGIRQALLYGLSIMVIYTAIGTVFSAIFGADAASIIATHWIPNVLFFVVFIVFAVSFFGAFDIVLPSRFVNSIDKQADKGGLIGIFFMALTLAVVSFSCTAPIAGSILFQSANGEFLRPMVGMLSFSLALALPFTLFAMFPSWLNALPKSGGWLNTVKVVLGFVELALAFKFLSVADQVYHWGLLDRPIFIAIWTAISIAMGMYLLGAYRLPHDSVEEKIGISRLLMGISTLVFAIYLIPGMFGAPLKALSGFLPPQNTNSFDIREIIREEVNTSLGIERKDSKDALSEEPKYADILHLPHGLDGYFELEQALRVAKAKNKPVFIDFTGHGCVNCREMEANVWSETPVLNRLKDDFVVVALYVDERKELEESEYRISKFDSKTKTTVGKINADLQIHFFEQNAQPYYVLLSPEGQVLNTPTGYDLDVDKFVDFLDEGLENFERMK